MSRDELRSNIRRIVATFDAHDPGILDGVYVCACKWQGCEDDWYIHLADALADTRVVELPAEAAS